MALFYYYYYYYHLQLELRWDLLCACRLIMLFIDKKTNHQMYERM
jgi:hypothetical protein